MELGVHGRKYISCLVDSFFLLFSVIFLLSFCYSFCFLSFLVEKANHKIQLRGNRGLYKKGHPPYVKLTIRVLF